MMLVEYPSQYVPRPYPVYCANCGGIGHVYRTCNHPITSFGIICYRLCYDPVTNVVYPEYLMVQRKDSLSYVEFLRGKYDVNNTKYILSLFTNMTNDERLKLTVFDFDALWNEMWCKTTFHERNKNFSKEHADSKARFELLKNGVYIKTHNRGTFFFDINYIVDNTISEYNESEWGFPKGRRNINENDIQCALREFREETNVHLRNIRIIDDIKPIEEVFSGTNKVRYKHVYYVAKYLNDNEELPKIPANSIEVRDISWFDYNEAQNHIRPYNIERKELLKRLNQVIMRTLR